MSVGLLYFAVAVVASQLAGVAFAAGILEVLLRILSRARMVEARAIRRNVE